MKGASIDTDTSDVAALARAFDKKIAEAQAKKAIDRKNGTISRHNSGYPYYSWNAGVDPEDIPETREMLKSKGVHAEFNKHGDIKMESPEHFKRVVRAMGLYDRNGTVSPQNR